MREITEALEYRDSTLIDIKVPAERLRELRPVGRDVYTLEGLNISRYVRAGMIDESGSPLP